MYNWAPIIIPSTLSRAGTGTKCEAHALFSRVRAPLCNACSAPALSHCHYFFFHSIQAFISMKLLSWLQTLRNIFIKKTFQNIPFPNDLCFIVRNSTTHMEVHFLCPEVPYAYCLQGPAHLITSYALNPCSSVITIEMIFLLLPLETA